MKKIPVIELELFCKKMGFSSYIFSTENQPKNCLIGHFANIEMKFTVVKSIVCPNMVYLSSTRGGKNYICFTNVDHIIYEEQNDGVIKTLKIVCDSIESKGKGEVYTILVK